MNVFRNILLATLFIGSNASFAHGGNKKELTVIIDPGHGGMDPGTIKQNIYEKTIALNIGLKFGQLIKASFPSVKVVYTRDKDVFVPLHQRAEIANKNNADLFISIHVNSCPSLTLAGTETYILGLHRSEENLEVAKKENSVILLEEDYTQRYEGFDPNSSESYIMFELIQDEYLEQSASLANKVQDQFYRYAGRKNRGVKQAGFLVLRQTSMPSILVEAGFLSNPEDAKYICTDKGQANIANALFRAFKEYKSMIELKSEFRISEKKEKQLVSDSVSNKKIIKNSNKENISYSVQIAASQKDIRTTAANFNGLVNVKRVKYGNMYKYFFGNEVEYESIKPVYEKVRKKFPGCFVVAIKNGKAIPVTKLQENH